MSTLKIRRLFLGRRLGLLAAAFFCLVGLGISERPAQAQLKIEVSGVGGNKIPIAIATFVDYSNAPVDIAEIVRSDLTRSGAFSVIKPDGPMSESARPEWTDLRSQGVDAVVGGSFLRLAGDKFEIKYRLQLGDEKTAWGFTLEGNAAFVRAAAHKIADQIYEKLTGEKGNFSTRLAYVGKENGQFKLHVADWDGANAQVALTSSEPIISPRWSPDSSRIAYVSFENGKPQVFVQNIFNERRTKVADFSGSNSAPAWHPDGKTLAVVLTTEGVSKIYLINAQGGGTPRAVSRSTSSIETEPEFHPDGASIWFTSDRRGGKPQIYRLFISSGEIRPITSTSTYNSSPRVSKDGRMLTYISRRDNRFQIVVRDLETDTEALLSDGSGDDQSPSFSPFNRWILFTTRLGGKREVLTAVSVDGRNRQKLFSPNSDIREPDWGPPPN